MKKKLVPILVILALVIVGAGGYLMGQRSNNPVVETPRVENSTPEVTPDTTPEATPVVETTSPEPTPETVSPEPSVEPVANTTPNEQYFKEAQYIVYVKPDYLGTDGVPVFDRYKMDVSLGIDGLQKEVFRTSNQSGFPYFCVGVGYDDAAGYIQILDPTNGKVGYSNEIWFTTENPVVISPETNKDTGNQQSSGGNQQSGGKIDYSNSSAFGDSSHYLPEDQRTHDGGEGSHSSSEVDRNPQYTGSISGGGNQQGKVEIDYSNSSAKGDGTGVIPEDERTYDGGKGSHSSSVADRNPQYTGSIGG